MWRNKLKMIYDFEKIDNILEKYVNKQEKLVIFGAGQLANTFIDNTSYGIFSYIFDNDDNKWKKQLGNHIIKAGDELTKSVKQQETILIISHYDNDIACQLTELGYKNILSLRRIIKESELMKSIEQKCLNVCMIETSNFCNAKCGFCINSKLKRKKMHMPQNIFNKIIERLLDEKIVPNIFRLHCSGEPLLDPQLFEKIKHIKKEFPDSKVGYTTNFSTADEKIINQIIEMKQDYITISLNAINKDEYYKIMGLDYDRTLSNIMKLIKKRDEVKGNLKICVSAVVEDLENEQARLFNIEWRNKGVDVRLMKKGDWIEESYKKHNRNDSKIYYKDHICSWLYNEVCILSDGSYALCCFDAEGNIENINVNNTSIFKAMNSVLKQQIRLNQMCGNGIPQICQNCSFSIFE